MPLYRTPVTLRRYGPQTTGSDGRPTPDLADETSIMANIQPATGAVLQRLPEGDRSREVIRYSTRAVVQTAEQTDTTIADELVVDGVVYEVQTAERWRTVLPHTEGLAVRLQEADA